MPDETAITTDTTATVAVATEQPVSPPAEGKTFTQEDVNRIVAQRLAEDRVRRPAQPPAQPAPKPSKPEPSDLASELAAMKQQQAELVARLDFEKRTRGMDLDATKSDTLFKVFQANPTAFDEVVQMFGIRATATATSTAATAATQQPAPPPQPATPIPVSDRGSPPPSTVPLEERSLYEMSEADRKEYLTRHGAAKYAQKMMTDAKGKRSLMG